MTDRRTLIAPLVSPGLSLQSTCTDEADTTFRPDHLRTLSMASSMSSRSPTPAGSSKRMGINLGLSVVGDGPSGFSSPSSRRSSPLAKQSATMTPLPVMSEHGSPTRSDSPIKQKADLVESRSQELSQRFRLLASKEMEILEINNAIKELKDRRGILEFETRDLKVSLERQLVQRVTRQRTNARQHPSSTGSYSARTTLQDELLSADSTVATPIRNGNGQESPQTGDNKRASWLTGPMSFLQQFDNLISQEFDRLQISNLDERQQIPAYKRHSQNNENTERNTDSSGRIINTPLKSLTENPAPTEIVQSVSNHLWSFVNEVKSNLLLDESIADMQKKTKLDRGSTEDTGNPDNASNRLGDDSSQVSDSDLWDNEDLLEL